MNIITKKVRLIPAPFVGTSIRIKLEDPDSLNWGINFFTLAEGHDHATIDWGDGSRQEVTARTAQHDYGQPGEYEIRITDDLEHFRIADGAKYRDQMPRVLAFSTNAKALTEISARCFISAVNLTSFSCEGSGVKALGGLSFSDCTSLTGRLNLKNVVSIYENAFANCPGITELHFAEENESVISALSGFSTAFGAANASISFDL